MTDLSTRYLGLDLGNPLIASAGPLTGNLDMLRRLAGAGAAAVVLPSLFEEEIRRAIREQEHFFAIGANDIQTVRAFREAEAWPGPSLLIAYSTCIAHGIDMSRSMTHQKDAVRAGYWLLYRYRPGGDEHTHPFQLDSKDPSIPLAQFTAAEGRFSMLARANPAHAAELLALAQADVDERWRFYRQLAGIERSVPPSPDGEGRTEAPPTWESP